MKTRTTYSGFTLIEILVVVGLIAILAAVTIVAINPAKNFAQTRDAQRSSDVTAVLNAITQFTSEEGNTIESFLAEADLAIPDGTNGAVNTELADEIACADVGATVTANPIAIANGVGVSPADLDTSGTDDDQEYIDIADGTDDVALLVDEYIVAIPEDPSQAVTTGAMTDTGYTMCVTEGGRVTVTATPERAASISVSR